MNIIHTQIFRNADNTFMVVATTGNGVSRAFTRNTYAEAQELAHDLLSWAVTPFEVE